MSEYELPFEDIEEVPGSREDEDDLQEISQADINATVVWGTDWTTETILRQMEKGNILLNPKFQRRDAWDKHRKSAFIESVILGLPIPQIVLAESKDKRGKYIVLDGKQRLLSIRQFAAAADDKDFQTLSLAKLEIRSDLNGHSLLSMRSIPKLEDDVARFENQSIRTVVIKNWAKEDFLYRVFLRLNTGSVKLSPQELRQALHPGKFIDFVEEISTRSSAIQRLLNLKKPDFRMRDVELFVRYYAFKNFIASYNGSLKTFLDTTCKDLNAAWDEQRRELVQQCEDFEAAYQSLATVFSSKNICRKWTGHEYESRFNRAIFDVMFVTFSLPETRERVSGHEAAVEESFKRLCATDREFLNAIERTTKTIDATAYRLSKWASVLNNLVGTNIPVPSVHNGRII